MNFKGEPRIVQDFWNIINYDQYAWIPVWGPGRCGKTTLAMLVMFKIYKDWDDVLAAIVFNLNQFLFKMRKGEPKLFPTLTQPCHMRVPVLLIDDFASSCGKAKTQHEKSWDIVKGSWDVLGTRVAIVLASMIEPTSPTEQLLLKYTHEIKIERITSEKRLYKYDTCERQQDFKGWRHRQKKDWIEQQEFGKVPLDVYKQYDEMRLSLVDEVFETITDSMVEDTLESTLKRLKPIDHQLIRLIKTYGPINHHRLKNELGELGLNALSRCKARGLIVPRRKSKAYYVYDITDFGLEVLNACETQASQSSIRTIT